MSFVKPPQQLPSRWYYESDGDIGNRTFYAYRYLENGSIQREDFATKSLALEFIREQNRGTRIAQRKMGYKLVFFMPPSLGTACEDYRTMDDVQRRLAALVRAGAHVTVFATNATQETP